MSLYYEDEFVTLYHGDCLTEHREWLEADVLVTDPPYGIAWAVGSLSDNPKTRAQSTQSIANDEDLRARDAVLEAWGTKRPSVVFGTWRLERPRGTTHRLIWHKAGRQPGITTAAVFPNDEEIYLVGGGWQGKPLGSVITTTEQRGQQPKLIGHPTPKPIPLMEALVAKCPPGAVADPFSGSGATLLAAKNLGRKVIGVELEEKYCEIIAARCSQEVLDFGAIA